MTLRKQRLKVNKNFIVNENCAEASTNGAKFQFDSFGELVCELRQIVSPAVLRDSFVVGFLLIFVCFVFEFVRSLRLVAYFFPIKPRSRSEAKVGRKESRGMKCMKTML